MECSQACRQAGKPDRGHRAAGAEQAGRPLCLMCMLGGCKRDAAAIGRHSSSRRQMRCNAAHCEVLAPSFGPISLRSARSVVGTSIGGSRPAVKPYDMATLAAASPATCAAQKHAVSLPPQRALRQWAAGPTTVVRSARLHPPQRRLVQRCRAVPDPFGQPSKLFDSEMFNKDMME